MAPLTVPTILAWDPAAIYDVFRIAKAREGTLADFGTNLRRTQNTLADWTGEAAEAFHQAMNRRRVDVDADGHESARVAKAAARAEQDVESVRNRMKTVKDYLNSNRIDVADDGSLSIQPGYGNDPAVRKVFEAQSQTGYGLTVREIMADADRVDEELAAAIRAVVGDEQLDDNGRAVSGTQKSPSAPTEGVSADQLLQIMNTKNDNISLEDAKKWQPYINKALPGRLSRSVCILESKPPHRPVHRRRCADYAQRFPGSRIDDQLRTPGHGSPQRS